MPHLSLTLFGGFKVTLEGEPVTAFGADKVRALLAFLAVESARPHRRAEMAGMFWPDLPEKKAAHSLSQALLRLRSALGKSPVPQPFLLLTPQDIQFNPHCDHSLDVAHFTELLNARRQHHHSDAETCSTCIEWLRQAASLYRGDLLAGFFVPSLGFEEWRLVRQEALHRQALETLAELAAYHERRGEYEQVQGYARRQVALEPWREEAHMQLMRALALQGQPTAALEQYETYRRTLAQELGLLPSTQAAELYEQIKAGEIKRPGEVETVSSPFHPSGSGPAERRQVTALVCGRGQPGRSDPEELCQQLDMCRLHCEGILDRLGGHHAQRQGTECLIYFGYPRAFDDAARRAVQAGLAIAAALKDACPVRIGIHTGEMVASEPRGPGPQHRELIGQAPDIARGCQSLAEPDTVLITQDTERLVRGWFDYKPWPHSLEMAHPVEIFQVLGPSGAPSRLDWLAQTQSLTSLAGRQQEMARLVACWDQARRGDGQVVLIKGGAGIGKSRLVWELKRALARTDGAQPVLWLESYCTPYFQNTSLHPVIGLFGQLLGFEADDSPEVKRDKLSGMFARFNLARPAEWLLSHLLGLPTQAPVSETITAEQRERMREVFVALLQKRAAQQPVVLVIEDLHWGDPTTLEWLGRSFDSLAAVPCLALLVFRSTFTPPWPPRAHLLPLTLEPLSPDQAGRMVTHLMGDRVLSDEMRQRIVAQTDGIPLFVEELTKTVLNMQPSKAWAIPATLRDSLTARLDHAGTAKETAQWAAVLGREFSYPVLRAVAPFDERRLQSDLAALVEAGLVNPQGQADYAFKHILIQEAIYATLLKRTQQDYHRRTAQTLETRFPHIVETQPEILAQHYANAGLPTQAIDYWLRAGERATAQGAALEARNFFDRAIEQIEAGDRERRWRALEGRERVLDLRGERAAQEADLMALLDLAQAFDDDARRAQVLLQQSHYAGMQGDYRATLPLAETAGAAAHRAGNLTLELQALAYKAQTLTFFREMVAARQAVEKALAQVDRVVDDSVRAQVLTVAAHYYMESGNLVRSAQLQRQGVEAAQRAGKHNLELTISANLGLIYAQSGLYAQARDILEAGLARAEAVSDRRLYASNMRHLGYVYWLSGERRLAQQMEGLALKELAATGDAYGQAACQAYLGYIHEQASDLDLAAHYLAQACAGFAELGVEPDRFEAQAAAARVALAQGRPAEARQLALQVWSYLGEHGTERLSAPAWVYVCIADVMAGIENPDVSPREVTEAGYRELTARAEKISDAQWRQSFLENVPENRTIVERRNKISLSEPSCDGIIPHAEENT